jgi:hypothetical protein
MITDIKKLLKVSSYAKKMNVSHTHVYKLGKIGKIKIIIIDGVNFVYYDE